MAPDRPAAGPWAVPAATLRTLAAGAAGVLSCRSLNASRYDEPAMPPTREPLRRTGLAVVALAVALIATACGSTPASGAPSPASPSSTTVAAASPSVAPHRRARADRRYRAARPSSPGPSGDPQAHDDQHGLGRHPRRRPRRLPALPGRQGHRGRTSRSAPPSSPTRPTSTRSRAGTATRSRPRGYATIDLSDPLEDGSRVLDSQADLPECQVQTTFRPEGGSTMITVLFAAGCVAIGG